MLDFDFQVLDYNDIEESQWRLVEVGTGGRAYIVMHERTSYIHALH